MRAEVQMPPLGGRVFVIPKGTEKRPDEWWPATLLSVGTGIAVRYCVRSEYGDRPTENSSQWVERIAVESKRPDPKRMESALKHIADEMRRASDDLDHPVTPEWVEMVARRALNPDEWTRVSDERVGDGTFGGAR
jgi:hypothetical protein